MFAGLVFPDVGQMLVLSAPLVVLGVLWWLITRTDQVINRIFPDLEWEHSLGWLNIKAERQAKTGLRWIGYGIYILLFDSLFGIVWGAKGLPHISHWTNPWDIGGLALRMIALFSCLGIWVLYLGCGLIPKLRLQREEAEFLKFRKEAEEAEEARELEAPSRLASSLKKPRKNVPTVLLVPQRMGRRR
jgi:hypothetical protein